VEAKHITRSGSEKIEEVLPCLLATLVATLVACTQITLVHRKERNEAYKVVITHTHTKA
jgi:hypothetical protein